MSIEVAGFANEELLAGEIFRGFVLSAIIYPCEDVCWISTC